MGQLLTGATIHFRPVESKANTAQIAWGIVLQVRNLPGV